MSIQELSQKADIALADLQSNGGLLEPEQNDQFIRNLVDEDTVLRLVRTVPMNAPKMNINKIGFASNILRPASQNRAANTSMHQGRYLADAQRSSPTTSKVSLETQEIMAEVRIPYEVLEDNIERGQLQNTILAMISEKSAEELENLFINGSLGGTGGANPWLDLMDGVLAKANAHIYDAGQGPISPSLFNEAKKTLPTKYRANLAANRWISSMDVESDYRLAVATRNTQLGDSILTGTQALPVFGIPLVGAAFVPNSSLLLTNPRNLIFGIQRNIRLQTDTDIRSREIIIVVTMRIAIGIEETDAVVKVTNIGGYA